MRIISGKFKGRRLVSFDEDHIRPTTDRVKESLFNIIRGKIEEAKVLDLYAGTGNLGIEAISQGASTVDMVESSFKSIQVIRRNLDLVKVTNEVVVHKSDVIQFLQNFSGQPYDIILIDPPFPSKIGEKTLIAVSNSEVATPESTIAIEHSRQEPLPDKILTLRRVDTRDYGDKVLSFFKKEDE